MHLFTDHNWFDTFSKPKWLLTHKSLQLDVDNHHGLVEYIGSTLCNFGERKKWTSNRESKNVTGSNSMKQTVGHKTDEQNLTNVRS